MLNLLLLVLLCRSFSSIDKYRGEEMLRKQFLVRITNEGPDEIIGLRSLFKSKVIERALRGILAHDLNRSQHLEFQIKMYKIYEQARKDIEHSMDDTVTEHYLRILEKMKRHDEVYYKNFFKRCNPIETIDLGLPLDSTIVGKVFLLLSGWCQELGRFPLNDEIITQILITFDYLEIDHDEVVDVFLDRNSEPLHLRMKAIHLFCINFVYLLETQGLLPKYQAILKAEEKRSVYIAFNKQIPREEKADNNIVAICIKNAGPLAHYIQLLQIKMDKDHVVNLYLGTDTTYFVYDLLHEENCKCIRLQHKNDYKKTPSKLDLLVEFNTINRRTISRKIDIVLPFCREYWYMKHRYPIKLTTDDIIIFHSYIHAMGILDELTEVSIRNLVHYADKDSVSQQVVAYVDSLLVFTVIKAIRLLPGLNALFIRGFHKFPADLIPVLKSKRLIKFGAMSACGVLDYLVIYQIFHEDSPLKRSITHFVGHFRALLFISKFLAKDQITGATITREISGFHVDFFDDEQIVVEQIKGHFNNDSIYERIILKERLQINTVYHMVQLKLEYYRYMTSFRPLIEPVAEFEESGIDIKESEILDSCLIENLVVYNGSEENDFLKGFSKAVANEFKTIEYVINNESKDFFIGGLYHKFSDYGIKCSCLIVNLNAYGFLQNQANTRRRGFDADEFDLLIKHLIIESNVNVKVRLRQRDSARQIKETIMESFLKRFRDIYEREDLNLSFKLTFESVGYNTVRECSLESISL
ncbi:hypothetical protein ENBRE01_0414 [Enteropsectra breve]|nr:hypothetical protein ENBRE01_0414 [Enteropsectra breve]